MNTLGDLEVTMCRTGHTFFPGVCTPHGKGNEPRPIFVNSISECLFDFYVYLLKIVLKSEMERTGLEVSDLASQREEGTVTKLLFKPTRSADLR